MPVRYNRHLLPWDFIRHCISNVLRIAIGYVKIQFCLFLLYPNEWPFSLRSEFLWVSWRKWPQTIAFRLIECKIICCNLHQRKIVLQYCESIYNRACVGIKIYCFLIDHLWWNIFHQTTHQSNTKSHAKRDLINSSKPKFSRLFYGNINL